MKRVKKFLKKSYIATKREINETKEMILIFKRGEKEQFKEATKQLVDLFKIIFLLPIMILPGSAVILTLLELIARFFKFSIFPTKQKFKRR
jgi:hypothetical protein